MADIDYALGLERGILGICLLEPTALLRAEQHLTSTDFSDRRHARLFQIMVEMRKRGVPMGPINVGLELQRLGASAEISAEALEALISDPASLDAHSLDERIRRLKDEVTRRGLERSLNENVAALRDRAVPLENTLATLRQTANAAEAKQAKKELQTITDVADEMLEQLDKGWPVGTPTCVPTLDWAIQGGIKPTQLIVLAGWTGSGKTSLGTQITVRVANWAKQEQEHGRERGWVLFFSFEMGREELISRFVSQAAPIADGFRPPDGFSRRDRPKVKMALSRIRDLPIRIEDASERTVEAVRGATERHIVEHGQPALVIVDHIHLMKDPNVRGGRSEEIAAITGALKAMAMQLRVPILALAQMNREVGKRDSHEPQLTDLKESGCLTGDSRVFLPDTGEYRPISELVGQSGLRVLAIDPKTWKLEPREVTKAFATGRKPVFRLTTKLGRTIRATANHKFLALDGWLRLDELAIGSRIALPRELNADVEQTMSDAKVALLGHLIGDGCVLPRHVTQYTTKERELAEIITRLADEAFGGEIKSRISPERTWLQVYLTGASLAGRPRNPIARWFKGMGIYGLRSWEKRVPDVMFAQPKPVIARFLRHLWATDGCIHGGGDSHYPRIYYSTSSPELARDVQSLLLRFGINAKHNVVMNGDRGRPTHNVTLSGREEIRTFLEEVGTVGERRGREAKTIISHLTSTRNTNRDVIPIEAWETIVVPALELEGVSRTTLSQRLGNIGSGSALYGASMSRERAGRVAIATDSSVLAALAVSDIYWDKIVSVDPDGEEDVYDITVENLHSFVVNDIISHNSIEQDANIVLMVHRPSTFYTDPAQRALEEEKGAEAFVFVSKNRSGPTGKVRFDWLGPRYLFREHPEELAKLKLNIPFENYELDLSLGADLAPEDLIAEAEVAEPTNEPMPEAAEEEMPTEVGDDDLFD